MTDDTGPTARKIEQVLRDAGCSKRFARALLAGGWKAATGEAETDPAEAALAAKIRAAIKDFHA